MGANERHVSLDGMRRNDASHLGFWLDMHDVNLIKETQTERQFMKNNVYF